MVLFLASGKCVSGLKSAQCRRTGCGPHTLTFDGKYCHTYVGNNRTFPRGVRQTVVHSKTQEYPEEEYIVQSENIMADIRVVAPSYPTPTCALAARCGNQVVILDACKLTCDTPGQSANCSQRVPGAVKFRYVVIPQGASDSPPACDNGTRLVTVRGK